VVWVLDNVLLGHLVLTSPLYLFTSNIISRKRSRTFFMLGITHGLDFTNLVYVNWQRLQSHNRHRMSTVPHASVGVVTPLFAGEAPTAYQTCQLQLPCCSKSPLHCRALDNRQWGDRVPAS